MEMHLIARDPYQQFHDWFKDAESRSGLQHVNAMALATADAAGRPSVRMVLLKGFSQDGFVFFTNHQSHKGRDLAENPFAALCFYWDKIGRQVRVEGAVSRLGAADSATYFHSRPRMSQIGAWASHQSEEIASRAELLTRVDEMEKKFHGAEVPLPEFWGGYVLRPSVFEFWQHGEFRLHDRFEYRPSGDGWGVRRLSP